jgi:hypothetical protein
MSIIVSFAWASPTELASVRFGARLSPNRANRAYISISCDGRIAEAIESEVIIAAASRTAAAHPARHQIQNWRSGSVGEETSGCFLSCREHLRDTELVPEGTNRTLNSAALPRSIQANPRLFYRRWACACLPTLAPYHFTVGKPRRRCDRHWIQRGRDRRQ